MAEERRKIRIGRVVSEKMDKTVVVAVEWRQRHRLYGKLVRRLTTFRAHDEDNACHVGDMVQIEETRPLSKTKRWRVREILSRQEGAVTLAEEAAAPEASAQGPQQEARR